MEDVINILDIKNEENVLLWSIPEVVSYEKNAYKNVYATSY